MALRIAGRGVWGPLLALAVALVLRVPYVTTRSIWYDEAFSWQTAGFPFSETMGCLVQDAHPPLYYWALKAWIAVAGDSVLALRGLSVIFGLLTVAGMYLAAGQCAARSDSGESAGRRSFLPTAVVLLVAVNAFQVNAAIETRMYAMGTALTAFTRLGSLEGVGGSQLLVALDHLRRALHGHDIHPPSLPLRSRE